MEGSFVSRLTWIMQEVREGIMKKKNSKQLEQVLRAIRLTPVNLAPVILEKVGDSYKVKSGRHRMKMARELKEIVSVFIMPELKEDK